MSLTAIAFLRSAGLAETPTANAEYLQILNLTAAQDFIGPSVQHITGILSHAFTWFISYHTNHRSRADTSCQNLRKIWVTIYTDSITELHPSSKSRYPKVRLSKKLSRLLVRSSSFHSRDQGLES